MSKKRIDIIILAVVSTVIYFLSKMKKNPIPATVDEQLTTNFRLKEFHCKDGSAMPYDVYLNIKQLAKYLQHLRDINDKPIKINSGYRSPEYNKKVGGATNSYHMKGMAADFNIVGITPRQVREIIELQCELGKMPCGGLGAYNNFTHYDFRDQKARWNG